MTRYSTHTRVYNAQYVRMNNKCDLRQVTIQASQHELLLRSLYILKVPRYQYKWTESPGSAIAF